MHENDRNSKSTRTTTESANYILHWTLRTGQIMPHEFHREVPGAEAADLIEVNQKKMFQRERSDLISHLSFHPTTQGLTTENLITENRQKSRVKKTRSILETNTANDL